MGAKQILETYSSRWGIEECFHDLKEVWRSGEQQVRKLWSNVACWQLNCWTYILTELECWDIESEELVDRSDRPWDNPDRRPSHADRRRWIAGKMLRERFTKELFDRPNEDKFSELLQELLALAELNEWELKNDQSTSLNFLPKVQELRRLGQIDRRHSECDSDLGPVPSSFGAIPVDRSELSLGIK